MRHCQSIGVLVVGLCAIACIKASNETLLSVLTNANNYSSLTTASNASNSGIAKVTNSLAEAVTTSSDRRVSDVSGQSLSGSKSSNNSQHNILTKDCFGSVCNENAPKVLVTHKSLTSVSIAFDDFKLTNYESGYVVQYRQHPNETNDTNDISDWRRMQANNTPFVTIKDLRPHTTYQIQVLVWEDIESKKLGLGSEIISVSTEDGCFANNTSYSVGQEFFDNCDSRCACRANAKLECTARSINYINVNFSNINIQIRYR